MKPVPQINRMLSSSLPLSEEAPQLAGKVFKLDEVRKHNRPDDLWIVISGDVYDVTQYAKEHPGGLAPLLIHGGAIDSTATFFQVFLFISLISLDSCRRCLRDQGSISHWSLADAGGQCYRRESPT